MARKDDLKKEWKGVLQWQAEVKAAQEKVLAEEGELVPINRAYAHMRIESNGVKDAKSGPNAPENRCPDPGVSCGPEFRAHGLFQIYWPPFKVDWSKIYDAKYNCYVGLKTLAQRKKQCGSWDAASVAFFAGSCVDLGTIDPNTGTDQKEYAEAMQRYMKELQEIGIGEVDSSPPPSKDQPKDGSPNTPKDGECIVILGKEICKPSIDVPTIDPTQMIIDRVMESVRAAFPRLAIFVIGLVILIIGARSVI